MSGGERCSVVKVVATKLICVQAVYTLTKHCVNSFCIYHKLDLTPVLSALSLQGLLVYSWCVAKRATLLDSTGQASSLARSYVKFSQQVGLKPIASAMAPMGISQINEILYAHT